MWYNNVGTSFFRFVTIRAFDRQADRQTDRQKGLGNTVRCIKCSRTVKVAITPPRIVLFRSHLVRSLTTSQPEYYKGRWVIGQGHSQGQRSRLQRNVTYQRKNAIRQKWIG